ncbi:MAG: rSAM/selenodomain-associated transferase 1 [Flavobacteriales bacterium]|jgi:rSAM/selenodomain-associated transferase 1
MSNTLIVFAKTPEWGKVKTRLAATIGNDKALEAYHLLLKHTEAVIAESGIPLSVYFTSKDDKQAYFSSKQIKKHIQIAGDLGDKMKHAFQEQFDAGHNKVVVIGTDCYELKATHILQAFEELENHDVLLGPANDGGYYLLGCNKFVASLFENIPWSTDTVMQDTIAVIEEKSLTYTLLETLVDVDIEEELGNLKTLLF